MVAGKIQPSQAKRGKRKTRRRKEREKRNDNKRSKRKSEKNSEKGLSVIYSDDWYMLHLKSRQA